MGHHTVMLSAAKHLAAQRDRPFAAAQGALWGSSKPGNTVMLSAAKHLDAQTDPSLRLRVTL